MNVYPYRPAEPLTRDACQVMSVRFAPDWKLSDVKDAVHYIGGELKNDGRGGLIVVRRTGPATTLCWRCSYEHAVTAPHCPECSATNANVDPDAASAECVASFVKGGSHAK